MDGALGERNPTLFEMASRHWKGKSIMDALPSKFVARLRLGYYGKSVEPEMENSHPSPGFVHGSSLLVEMLTAVTPEKPGLL